MIGAAEAEIRSATVESDLSAVSWGAILAGGAASAALTLVLLALGAGLGFSVVSPWPNAGVSTTSFGIGAGLYLIVVAMIASSVGGYLAGRLRTKWSGVATDEVYFRDTAHGFLAWAFATVLGVGVLAASATHIAAGASGGLTQAAGNAAAQSMDVTLDRLMRGSPATTPASSPDTRNADATRAELGRLLAVGLAKSGDFPPGEFTYAAQLVASRSGLSAAEAEKRLTQIINESKSAADSARRMARNLALWLTASLLIGAFSASLAATEGGGLRDGTWLASRRRIA